MKKRPKKIYFIAKRYKIAQIFKMNDKNRYILLQMTENEWILVKICEANAIRNIFYDKICKTASFVKISEENVLNGYILLQKATKLQNLLKLVKK